MGEGADQWEVVFLPALALESYPKDEGEQKQLMLDGIYVPLADPLKRAPGAALWPTRFTADWLKQRKVNIDEYEFESQYQQNPYSREGGFLKREWFSVVESGPGKDAVARVRYWDKAASKLGDYTAGALVSVDKDGVFYIEHMVRAKLAAGERDRMMAQVGLDDYITYGVFPIWHQQDPGSAGKDSAEATNAILAEQGLRARFEPVTGDKTVRADSLASKAQSGKVRLVRGAWNQAFLDEAVAFPNGRNDDQVDGNSSAVNKLLEMTRKHRESRIL
jgi:predicted phage terminase large subunit-like protein